MSPRATLAGAASGLLLAAILIAGVSLAAGGGSLHIDLVKSNGPQIGGSSPQSSPVGWWDGGGRPDSDEHPGPRPSLPSTA